MAQRADDLHFEYLNLDLSWDRLELHQLETGSTGQLTLARIPHVIAEVEGDAATISAVLPTAPGGIAITPACECDVYLSDPANHKIYRYDACADESEALQGVQGPGSELNQVNTPRGLALHKDDDGLHLYIADSGNHRILVLDTASQQVTTVLGQSDPSAPFTPGSGPGELNDPWALAAAADGNLFVVDHGNARVQKFFANGMVDGVFGQTLAAQPNVPTAPINLTAAGQTLFILDENSGAPRICVFTLDGAAQAPYEFSLDASLNPLAVAANASAIYVGGADGTILKFDTQGQLMSALETAGTPTAALAIGCNDALLVGTGGLVFRRLKLDLGFLTAGYFRVGPFETNLTPLAWHRWRVMADELQDDAHLQLFTYSSADTTPPPDAGGDNPFAMGWSAQPRDVTDVLVLSPDVRAALAAGIPADPSADKDEGVLQKAYFWLGGLLRGDGVTSPTIRQMRIDYAPRTYIRYLPAIYREGKRRRLPLDLILATLGSELGRVEQVMGTLPALFDPAAAPEDWLPWLASWLDFDLMETWSIEDRRRYLAQAIALYAQRGTAEGLRKYLELYTGVHARVEEPNANVSLFALDENVALGLNTVLAPAHEQGAIVGTTAVPGYSHLLDEQDIGAPLFEDVAHRFCVQVYDAELTDPRTMADVQRVIEREKPAHAAYHLCVIGANMRVGFQARLGIDSIVAGPPPDLLLGEARGLGVDTALASVQ